MFYKHSLWTIKIVAKKSEFFESNSKKQFNEVYKLYKTITRKIIKYFVRVCSLQFFLKAY